MSNKLLSIIGPTAVGKTSFLLELIDYLNEDQAIGYEGYNLISADSRQVYKDLEIISGADLPSDFTLQRSEKKVKKEKTSDKEDGAQYYLKDNIKLYGLLNLNYSDEWSLAHFKKYAQGLIKQSWKENRLPIIVGGTGLYHQYLFNDSSTIGIGPNENLRKELSLLSLGDLQKKLEQVNRDRFEDMNNSDRNNPVRLIRAIEVATSYINDLKKDNLDNSKKDSRDNKSHIYGEKPDYEHLTIGLTDELENIEEKINIRVKERFDHGAIGEIEDLMSKVEEFGLNKQIVTATGVKEIQLYLDGKIEKEECIKRWSLREYQYAKRQLTWWRHKDCIDWYEISKEKWKKEAFDMVNKFILSE